MENTLQEIVAQIDEWLALTSERDLFTGNECRDRLLDMRVLATERVPALA